MPVLDHICSSLQCRHVESSYHPLSEYPFPQTIKCPQCGEPSERNWSGCSPGTGFLVPPVVHYNKSTGQYSIPGHRDDAVDEGYEKVEIRDMRAYAKLTKSVDAYERDKAQYLQEGEKQFFDARLKEQREARKVEVQQAVDKGGYWREWKDEHGHVHRMWCPVTRRALGLLAASQKFVDKSIQARRARVNSGGANFHSRMLEHSKSEQSIVDGAGKKAKFFFSGKG